MAACINSLTTLKLLPAELEGKHAIGVCIDRGGTFTDCVATFPVQATPDDESTQRTVVVKLLSEDPAHYSDAALEAVWRVLEAATGRTLTRTDPLDTSNIAWVRMGTTVATNALLERKGERCVLVTTRGFGDVLHIGTQTRPLIFDLAVQRRGGVIEESIELDERVVLDPKGPHAGASGERLRVLREPDWAALRARLDAAYARGVRAAAVCLMHAYTFSAHERMAAQVARDAGFTHVTESSALAPAAGLVARAQSAAADAYLAPVVARHVAGFARRLSATVPLALMQSDGGLAPASGFSGLRAVLSGPAAGVVGCAATAYSATARVAVVGFDMGGTSTDVSRFDGTLEHVFGAEVGGVAVAAPQLAIQTVAAGGGSRLFFRGGLLAVGPESVGAHPGPACYRKGGALALTDANLVLGRLRAAHFPRIFGPREDEGLDEAAARARVAELAQRVASESGAAPMSVEALALGFVRVANEAMTRPIRSLTEARGHAPQAHALACFGGAGGQHACAVAAALGIGRVFVHRLASVLSAHGLALAEAAHEERSAAAAAAWTPEVHARSLAPRLDALEAAARARLASQGFSSGLAAAERFLNMRYKGADAALMVAEPADGDFGGAFERQHRYEFGFVLRDRAVVVDDLRVRATASLPGPERSDVYAELAALRRTPIGRDHAAFVEAASVYFDGGFRDTPVFRLDALAPGESVPGPAIVLDRNSTVLVEPGWTATATREQVVLEAESVSAGLDTQTAGPDSQTAGPIAQTAGPIAQTAGPIAQTAGPIAHPASLPADPVTLAVFAHRFMAIAEHMGRTLQKTSVSTNIKERLDFSCALFDAGGNLVANAPHIPVHLGSMSHAVKYQLDQFGCSLRPGDVVLANHPQAGGSHLPDITVITPVFCAAGVNIIFFVASRAHHADIGGIAPGSMPPASRELFQEGAVTAGFKVVDAGEFQDAAVRRFLLDEPARFPGCSGSRNYRDVVSDLHAQIAANQRGITLVYQLCDERGLPIVQAYMRHIQRTAEAAVRSLLRDARARLIAGAGADADPDKPVRLAAADHMDDGSRISLAVEISADGSAVFDFSGTSPEVYANTNAPPSVTSSAIIYCLRCMVRSDLPLNQGCLAPVTIRIPPGSLLAPSPTAAVVGGNVLTSQRLCDVILTAFGAAAASQGCMNNLTFGVPPSAPDAADGWGYYETIAGGHGAGPTWDGQSGVHTHMTNTRITDPETLERRYPVILHRFSLRPGSGGRGARPGGDGCVRDIEFLAPMPVSLLTERRVFQPPGLHGGCSGARGVNLWRRRTAAGGYRVLNLGGKNTVHVSTGDRIVVMTPGGGGYGAPPHSDDTAKDDNSALFDDALAYCA